MEHHDLKTILAQMEVFNIPGFAQLLSDLKDPLVPLHSKAKMKSITHNIDVLKKRLGEMQSVFKVQPDEVNKFMANSAHFSEQEQKAIASTEQQLHDYWKKLTKDLTDQSRAGKAKIASKTNGKSEGQSGPKPKGGRKGWIAS